MLSWPIGRSSTVPPTVPPSRSQVLGQKMTLALPHRTRGPVSEVNRWTDTPSACRWCCSGGNGEEAKLTQLWAGGGGSSLPRGPSVSWGRSEAEEMSRGPAEKYKQRPRASRSSCHQPLRIQIAEVSAWPCLAPTQLPFPFLASALSPALTTASPFATQ
ncbi:hypothetical protein PAL_GLEAN10024396 [Pteropus alecto]|uniref:Uncharacterized protein n=1 Tax=Pteropus alecto TaxID=9402 RepID=L5JXQ1_PTEAL|nr:hypothetical protein PAL_GLEAN10024396 [Pteropus alecto]